MNALNLNPELALLAGRQHGGRARRLVRQPLARPRPEDPEFASHYPWEFERILSTPPGIAGPNQVRFRNESELYPEDCEDRNGYYVEKILPLKLPADLAYIQTRGLFRDLVILLEVLFVTGFGLLPLERVRRRPIHPRRSTVVLLRQRPLAASCVRDS